MPSGIWGGFLTGVRGVVAVEYINSNDDVKVSRNL